MTQHAARMREEIFQNSTFWRIKTSSPGGEVRQPDEDSSGDRGTYAKWCPKRLSGIPRKVDSNARSFLSHQGRHMTDFAPGCYVILNVVFKATLDRMKQYELDFQEAVREFQAEYRKLFEAGQAYLLHPENSPDPRPPKPEDWMHLKDKEISRVPTPEELDGKYSMEYRWFTVGAAKTGDEVLDSAAFADLQNDLFLAGDAAMWAEAHSFLSKLYTSLTEKDVFKDNTRNNLINWAKTAGHRNISGNPELRQIAKEILDLASAASGDAIRKNPDIRTEFAAEVMQYISRTKMGLGGRDLDL